MKNDFNILKNYAKALGIKVFLKRRHANCDDAGYFSSTDDGSAHIIIYKDTTSTEVLTLLHEVGHLLDWLKNDKYFDTSEKRNDIVASEHAAINNSMIIYKALPLKISKWKVRAAQRYDRWVYNFYLSVNEFPPMKLRKLRRKQFFRSEKMNAARSK